MILIEPVTVLDMCCRCGAVFGRNWSLSSQRDYEHGLAEYIERETRRGSRRTDFAYGIIVESESVGPFGPAIVIPVPPEEPQT